MIPAKTRYMTTLSLVPYDQTGLSAGFRAVRRRSITTQPSQRVANIQAQWTFFRTFDPHFGHVILMLM
jgi:hypothetical protein